MNYKIKKVKLKATKKKLVSFYGLFPVAKAIENSICFEELNQIFKPSNKGYESTFKIKTLIYLLYCGGECLSDIKSWIYSGEKKNSKSLMMSNQLFFLFKFMFTYFFLKKTFFSKKS